MKKLVWLIFAIFLCGSAISTQAQTTTVTATVTDSDGTAWANGTVTWEYVTKDEDRGVLTDSRTGQTISPEEGTLTLNGSGAMSLTGIVPTQYVFGPSSGVSFRVCPGLTNPVCYTTAPISIGTSTPQDISTQINATIKPPRITGGFAAQAYADVEVEASNGNQYYNVTSGQNRCYAGGAWGGCGGTGSFTQLSKDAISGVNGGSTTVVGLNGTLLSGLATGLLKITTGTGVPSIAVAGTDYVIPSVTTLPSLSLPATQVTGLGTLATIATGTLTNGDLCSYSSTGPTISCNSTAGAGTVTSFAAPSASWPSWLVPTVATATTTPSLTVAASAIPYSAFTALAANQVLGALTATTPSGLTLPSCSTASSALTYTLGTGFGCNTISGSGTVNNGTANQFAFYSATGTAVSGNTHLTDNGTVIASTEQITAPSIALGSSPPSVTWGTGGGYAEAEGTAPSAGVPALNVDACYADSTAHAFKCSLNNGALFTSAMNLPYTGAGAAIPTGPTTSTSGDVTTFTGTAGQISDSGTLLSALAHLASPTFTGTVTLPLATAGLVTTTSGGVIGSEATATAAQIPAALSNTTSVNGTTIPASATLTQTIASGTATLGTAAIASGACATVVTATATGGATTDVISSDFNADPTAITGYGASATGAVLSIYKYVTANTANFKVCNSTSASITPGAATLNWRIVR